MSSYNYLTGQSAGQTQKAPVKAPQTTTQQDQSGGSDIPDYYGVYGQAQAAANDAFNKAQAAVQAKRTGIMSQYGYGADGSVDGNNPYGVYQQGRNQDAMELQGAENSALDRGLGTTGLGAQIAEAPRYGEGVRDQGIANDYLGQMQANDQAGQQAYTDRSNSLLDARNQEIQTAIAQGWFDTPPPAGGEATPPPSSNAKTTAARLTALQVAKKAAPTRAQSQVGKKTTPQRRGI